MTEIPPKKEKLAFYVKYTQSVGETNSYHCLLVMLFITWLWGYIGYLSDILRGHFHEKKNGGTTLPGARVSRYVVAT